MEYPKTFEELFKGTEIKPTVDEQGNTHYNFKAKKMEDKYFTPSIEDIRVGYKYEREEEGIWRERVICHLADIYLIDKKRNPIRVPYLTKEQIEAEGWKYSDTVYEVPSGYPVITYRNKDKNNIIVGHVPDRNFLMIMEHLDYQGETIVRYNYQGECKDINTFRYISKLLNI